jgi:hypothetical protein
MKKLLVVLSISSSCLSVSALAGANAGGPWANGLNYPGQLDGKYMGVVTGNNISGVLGFAIKDGAPPYRNMENPIELAGSDSVKQYEYDTPRIDVLQNYFAIFVQGRTYTGLTTAGIDIDSKTVAGALQGTDPIGVPAAVGGAPGPGEFRLSAPDALSIINRGLSGGFTAKVKSTGSVFTFKGNGQLSTPANLQSYTYQSEPSAENYTIDVILTDTITRPDGSTVTSERIAQQNVAKGNTVSGSYQTHSTAFNVKGIRTSWIANNPQATLDQAAASGGGAAGGGGQ